MLNHVDSINTLFLDPVDAVHLYSVKKDDIHDPLKYYEEYVDGQDVRMTDGEELYFRCMSIGSNPAAEVRVFLGDKELTSQVVLFSEG